MLAFAGTAFAQDNNATLVGRVTDISRAIIPGATITVTELSTNAVRVTTSNKDGDYSVADLKPDTYSVKVDMSGFKEASQPSVTLETGQTARFDVALKVGSVNEVVTVTTAVGALHTDTSDKGDVISPVEISEMPLDGRDFNDLVFNVAGVAPSEEGSKGSEFVANGVRSDQTNVIVDGVNNTNPRDSTAQATPPLDSLQEFKVQTSNYSAEYGRVAGPVINLQIRKGTNKLKGSIFEFVRNDLFDAGNYFDVPGTHSELRRNQFGGSVGGPLYIPHVYNGHNKTFFFVSEESYRQVQGVNDISIVPTVAERGGDFSNSFDTNTGQLFSQQPYPLFNPATGAMLSNDKLLTSDFDPTALELINQFYPLPTTQFDLPGANNYIVNMKQYNYWDNMLGKIDQQIASHDEANIKFLFRQQKENNPFASSDLGLWPSLTHNKQYIAAFNETHIFTPALINDFRIGLTRQKNDEHAEDAGINWAALLGIPGTTTDPTLEQFPYFNVNGYATLGDSIQEPVTYTTNNWDTNDTVTWSKGKHTIKFGFDMLRVQYIQPTNSEFSGDIAYSGKTVLTSGSKKLESATAENGLLEFLAGAPTTAGLRVGTVSNHLHDTSYSGFAQDDYKILPGLTLNLGARYELETLPYEENNQLSNFVPSAGKVLIAAAETPALDSMITALSSKGVPGTSLVGYSSQSGLPRTLVYPNRNRVAPRVGFAWRPNANDQTVIRGGYGIFYTGSRLTVIRTELSGQFPFSIEESCTAGNSYLLAFADLSSCKYKFTANGYDPHAPSSYVQSWNLTVEHELPKGLALEIAYTGSKGTHLGQQVDINQANPANGLNTTTNSSSPYNRNYPNFSTINDFIFTGYSNYNAGTATLRKRFDHGLLFRLNFTYGKSLDTQSGMNYAGNGGYKGLQDLYNPNALYGRSDFDRKLVLNGNFVYLLPFHRNILVSGWQSAGSVQVDSGLPLTPQYNGPSADQGEATLPNRICSGATSNPSVNNWFNTACFVQPAVGTFGNSGRNILTGPKLVIINLSLARNFRITETQKLQFRWEVFNVPNHPNFSSPNDFLDEANVASITKARDPRVMQLGARYMF
jgi:hypothetical protein